MTAESDPTVAILLGASEWPNISADFPGSGTFKNSADAFYAYLTRSYGLALPQAQVLNLFDSEKNQVDQLREMRTFVKHHRSRDVQNVIVYYVGHGAFLGDNREYVFPIRATDTIDCLYSTIRASDLSSAVFLDNKHLRHFIILDACFAAAAVELFQSGLEQAVAAQVESAFPSRGTALLCSSDKFSVSINSDKESDVTDADAKGDLGDAAQPEYTMFSGTLLGVLLGGIDNEKPDLSLRDIAIETQYRIKDRFKSKGVRPVLQSPNQQGDGDIAEVPLFPNRRVKPISVGWLTGDALRQFERDAAEAKRIYQQIIADGQKHQIDRWKIQQEMQTRIFQTILDVQLNKPRDVGKEAGRSFNDMDEYIRG